MLLYSLGLLAATIITSPYWLFRMLWSGRYRDGFAERLGVISPGLRQFIRGRRTIWVHAVSVGEVIAASRLIELLDRLGPDVAVVISTTTRTGQQLARQRFDDSQTSGTRIFYYPLDFGWSVRRYLRLLRPYAIVLMESELWPRMIWEAERASIPLIVVNGRISDRSLPRYQVLRALWRPFFRRLSLVQAQSEQDEQRFVAIGLPPEKVCTVGNLKYDVRTPEEADITRQLRTSLPSGSRILVAGSTLDGEESYLLKAFSELRVPYPDLVLILAPRHPERFRAVENLVKEMNLPIRRRSDWIQNSEAISAGDVFLLDSMGELASVYSLASVAFVGGSLIPAGGHNPLEPAQFGVPIVMGPYTENFRGIVAMLLDQDAMRVSPPERFASLLNELLASPATAEMGHRARQVFQSQAGASAKCYAEILALLPKNTAPNGNPSESR